ncbi:MAG: HAMP domain-containing histidine kinase, partial [Nitrospirae bacterium]|nr:HAMP domain-containing histidine kinase [Nitrospirota bacterium]
GGLYFLKKELQKGHQDVETSSEPEVETKGYKMVESSIGRLTGFVKDMLTFAKERKPECELMNVDEVVEPVVVLMRSKAKEVAVELEFESRLQPDWHLCTAGNIPGTGASSGGSAEIFADPQGIYRCVLNLVGNAIDACEKDKNAKVRVITSIASGGSEKEVSISVTDQGCGMDKDTLSSLFKPFFSTKGSKGTGLGLSVTNKIIQEHGGRIEVSSVVGEGTTFTIHLPVTCVVNHDGP